MRPVAVALPLLLLIAVVPPANAEDDCLRAGSLCNAVSTKDVPNAPQPAQKKYYVYWASLLCGPLDTRCQGVPPARVIGLVYEETNGLDGLQRQAVVVPGGSLPADKPVLA